MPKAPVLPNNTFFNAGTQASGTTPETPDKEEEGRQSDDGAAAAEGEVFRCSVDALPFGMQVAARPGSTPRVVAVLPGSPAARAGVRVGDLLMEVAGRPVSSATWFSSMQQASAPYGLLFTRLIQGQPELAAVDSRQAFVDDDIEPAE